MADSYQTCLYFGLQLFVGVSKSAYGASYAVTVVLV